MSSTRALHLRLRCRSSLLKTFLLPALTRTDPIFLYNDGCVPTHSAKDMDAYLKRLVILGKLAIEGDPPVGKSLQENHVLVMFQHWIVEEPSDFPEQTGRS